MVMQRSDQDLEALFVRSKDTRKSKKSKRQSFGDATDPESYKGPWAVYEESGCAGTGEEFGLADQPKAVLEGSQATGAMYQSSELEGSQATGVADQPKDAFGGSQATGAMYQSSSHDQTTPAQEQSSSTAIPSQSKAALIDLPLQKITSPSGEHSILHQEYSIQCNPIPPSLACSSNKRTFKLNHHTRSIYSIKLFPATMHLMLSCGADNTIKLWSSTFPTYSCLRTFIGHRSAVRDVDFNASGTHFASCSFDKSIKLWNTQKGVCIGKISLHSLPFIVLFVAVDSVVVALGDGSMEKYCVQSLFEAEAEFETTGTRPSTAPLAPPLRFEGHLAPINSITLLPEGKCFTTSEDKTARIWCLAEGTQLFYYAVPPSMSPLTAVTLHSASSTLACQSFRGKIFCLSLQLHPISISLNAKRQFYGFKSRGYICPLVICGGGSALASGDAEGNIFIWDWEKGFLKGKGERSRGHERAVSALVWNARDGCLISGGLDGVLCVQKIEGG